MRRTGTGCQSIHKARAVFEKAAAVVHGHAARGAGSSAPLVVCWLFICRPEWQRHLGLESRLLVTAAPAQGWWAPRSADFRQPRTLRVYRPGFGAHGAENAGLNALNADCSHGGAAPRYPSLKLGVCPPQVVYFVSSIFSFAAAPAMARAFSFSFPISSTVFTCSLAAPW